jgi:ribosomal-protein-alanine N-acetyltransferase
MTGLILESERLYLKQFTDENVNVLFRLNSDSDVMKYIKEPVTDINVIKESIKKLRGYYLKHPGFGVWAAFEKQSNKFIGFFELAHMDNTDEIEVGYRLLKEYWDHGYATEMTKELLNYGFDEMGLDQIVGITHPENIVSQKVLIKSGLRYAKDAFYYGIEVKYYVIDKNI